MLSQHIYDFATSGAFAAMSTLLPGGQPATQVMWVDADDDHLIINTELHRQKFASVQRDPRVTLCLWEPNNPYNQLEVRGTVVDIVYGAEARNHADKLAHRYFGRPYDPEIIKSERVLLKILPNDQAPTS